MPCLPVSSPRRSMRCSPISKSARSRSAWWRSRAVDRRHRGRRSKRWSPKHVVLDPVMVATSGDRLLAPDAVDALRTKLIPLATIITPNLPEAAALLDEPIAADAAAIGRQGEMLLALGCPAALIKGGHGEGSENIDYLVDARQRHRSRCRLHRASPRNNTHGYRMLAVGGDCSRARERRRAGDGEMRNAKAFVSAVRIAAADRFTVGHGHGPIHHFHRFYWTARFIDFVSAALFRKAPAITLLLPQIPELRSMTAKLMPDRLWRPSSALR